MPAFRDMEDDGPAFDYTEDPDFEDLLGQQSNPETQEPPEEVPENGRGDESASGNVSRRSRDAFEVGVSPPETPGSPLPPPVTPRPKIVTARVQHEKLRKDEGRRRARETREDIADIEGQHDGGGRAGRNRPSLKRPRTQVNSPGEILIARGSVGFAVRGDVVLIAAFCSCGLRARRPRVEVS